MCKSDTIVMIDSNDRTAASASTSDFTVNLPSQLLINDDNGIQLKSLYVPNTLKTINTGINDKLYTSLDDRTSTAYNIITFPTTNYDNASALGADLQAKLDLIYSTSTLTVQNAAGEWKLNNATPFNFEGSGLVYTRAPRTLTFSLTADDQLQVFHEFNDGDQMLLWNGENFGNVWWPPPDFTFSLNGKVVVSYTHSTITITPSEPHTLNFICILMAM